jgi:GNAT superfamily N-acetyltransferase
VLREAFGVLPAVRLRGIGRALQERAIAFHSLVLDISELLNQKKYLIQDYPTAKQKILLGAFEADSPVGPADLKLATQRTHGFFAR